ncbi:MAG: HEAT repeat domain-containing protein [Phycisphaerae bacterium]|nr:HEAT repeat domain-containing protein [Phycisphaerae bacterium]
MLSGRTVAWILVIGCSLVGTGLAQNQPQTLADNWNDFLHYTKIGRFDLAKGYAQAVLQANPDPAEIFKLVEDNQQGYALALKVAETAHDDELAQLTQQLLSIVDKGRFLRRTEPTLIVEEIKRLSTTLRGKMTATRRLQDAGEYAVPFMLDAMGEAIRNPDYEVKLADLIETLPKIGRPAIRPLAAALQTDNDQLKAEIIRALGRIGYPQGLPYLKYVVEKAQSAELRSLASESIRQIDPRAAGTRAAGLFHQLAERYYYHDESLAPPKDVDFANVWFWDADADRVVPVEVDQQFFHELMAMRCCEWSLKSDDQFGLAIGLWLASFFKAEATGLPMPEYFGENHATALVYATTSGPEYLHQALARGVMDRNAAVALGAVEALATTAGEKSLMYTLGPTQPLLQALTFPDLAVRYSAAIAVGNAGPRQPFTESRVVAQNLSEALARSGQQSVSGEEWAPELAESYALRSAQTLHKLAVSRNPVIDLSLAQTALMAATNDKQQEIQVLAAQVLAYLNSPNAQRAIAEMAMDGGHEMSVRVSAFDALVDSAKLNGCMVPDAVVGAMYALIQSTETDPVLRAAAAAAFGALNLPSQKVKDLILDQAKS